jgi:hypothetical protein
VIIRAVALLTCLLLASGCIPEQKQQTASCAVEGLKSYPADPNGNTGRRADFVRLCMAAAGYDFAFTQESCPFTSEMASDWRCYLPSDPVARIGRRIEFQLGQRL